MPKPRYFDPESYIDDIIKAMKTGPADAPTMLALRREIEMMLNERVVTAVIGSFGRRELDLFEKILEDHPELDEVDALMVIAPEAPGVKENLERAINSLFFELTYMSAQVEKGLGRQLTA